MALLQLHRPCLSVTELAASVVPWVSGGLWLGSAIAEIVNDSKKTTPEPDPYVVRLQDLTEKDTETTTSAATRFSQDLQTASGTFYVTVCLAIGSGFSRLPCSRSIRQGYSGWYVADENTDRSSYLQVLFANERLKLWQQVLPQYFSAVAYTGAASGWIQASQGLNSFDAANFFSKGYPTFDAPIPAPARIETDKMTSYSWDNRTSAGTAVCEDYIYIFQNGKFGTNWPNTLGENLMGNGVNSDGSRQLNMDRNFVYDFMQIPWLSNYPQVVASAVSPGRTTTIQHQLFLRRPSRALESEYQPAKVHQSDVVAEYPAGDHVHQSVGQNRRYRQPHRNSYGVGEYHHRRCVQQHPNPKGRIVCLYLDDAQSACIIHPVRHHLQLPRSAGVRAGNRRKHDAHGIVDGNHHQADTGKQRGHLWTAGLAGGFCDILGGPTYGHRGVSRWHESDLLARTSTETRRS